MRHSIKSQQENKNKNRAKQKTYTHKVSTHTALVTGKSKTCIDAVSRSDRDIRSIHTIKCYDHAIRHVIAIAISIALLFAPTAFVTVKLSFAQSNITPTNSVDTSQNTQNIICIEYLCS